VDAIAIALAWPRVGQIALPDEPVARLETPPGLFARLVEQAQLDGSATLLNTAKLAP